MGKHEEVTMGQEERLRQAARIFAAGAIRAAMRQQTPLAGKDARREAGMEPQTERRGGPAGPPECE